MSGTKARGRYTFLARENADIMPGHRWFSNEVTSEKAVQKFYTDNVSLPRSGWWHVISVEFLHLFIRPHFVGKPRVAVFSC